MACVMNYSCQAAKAMISLGRHLNYNSHTSVSDYGIQRIPCSSWTSTISCCERNGHRLHALCATWCYQDTLEVMDGYWQL